MSLDHILSAVAKTAGPIRSLELGRVKIGGRGEKRKTKDGKIWYLPRKDDHFTITNMTREAEGDGDFETDHVLMKELLADYGETDADGKRYLRQIPVRALSDEIDDVLYASFAWYGNRECGARSDGKTVTWYRNPKTRAVCDPPKVEAFTEQHLLMTDSTKYRNKLFKLHCNVSLVIASRTARFGGVYRFRTTSVISFKQMYASLLHIQQLTGGILMGVPLMMCIRPMQVNPEVGGQRQGATIYVTHFEVRGPDLMRIQADTAKQAQFRLEYASRIREMQERSRALMSTDESVDEQAAIADEYAPPEPLEPPALPVIDAEPESGYEDLSEPETAEATQSSGGLDDLLAGDVGQREIADRSEAPLEEEPEPEAEPEQESPEPSGEADPARDTGNATEGDQAEQNIHAMIDRARSRAGINNILAGATKTMSEECVARIVNHGEARKAEFPE